MHRDVFLTTRHRTQVVAILWHQGEYDSAVRLPVSAWASCLGGLITRWRGLYGASTPFSARRASPVGDSTFRRRMFVVSHPMRVLAVAGTFTFAQQNYFEVVYIDFLRHTFGGTARYGMSS